MENEIHNIKEWRKIPNFEDYELGDYHQVRSIDRKIIYSNNKVYFYKGKVLKQEIDSNKRTKYVLCLNKKKISLRLHQIVAMVFHNHIPDKYNLIVDHIDGDFTNNHPSNLQIITNRENCTKDQFRHNRSSIYAGVSWDKSRNKWQAGIRINSKRIGLGRFDSEYDAHLAYQRALQFHNQKTISE